MKHLTTLAKKVGKEQFDAEFAKATKGSDIAPRAPRQRCATAARLTTWSCGVLRAVALRQDLATFLIARIHDDNHAYAYVAGALGGEALLYRHLPMLDLIEQLANDYKTMDPSDSRSAGLAYALRILGHSYTEHPAYQQAWRP